MAESVIEVSDLIGYWNSRRLVTGLVCLFGPNDGGGKQDHLLISGCVVPVP